MLYLSNVIWKQLNWQLKTLFLYSLILLYERVNYILNIICLTTEIYNSFLCLENHVGNKKCTYKNMINTTFCICICSFFIFKDCSYLFLERGEGKEIGRERNISVWLLLPHLLQETWPASQACALTGNWTGDTLLCSPLNPLSHASRGCPWSFLY